MVRKILAIAVALSAITGVASARSDGTGFKTGSCRLSPGIALPGSSGRVLRVPGDSSTIQGAVDLAREGDTILVGPGVYNEHVRVRTDALRIRGTDRNAVVLDGESRLEIGMDVTSADRVLIENMTAHNYTRHGFLWYHATGYWGRYLTGYNNGLYGIYAFDSRCGQFDNSHTSGNADSGFYIGECFPCDAVITNIVAERNALGYSGTNAGGNLTLRDSDWINNAMAIVPNSLDGEDRPPQRGATIAHNRIIDNNNKTAPGVSLAGTFYGVGIAIAGGNANVVYGNSVIDHALAGVVLAPLPDQHLWIPSGNTIWGNVVRHDAARFPATYDLAQGAASGPNNCWADNDFGTSAPVMIQAIYDCGAMATPPGGDPRVEQGLIEGVAGLNGRAPSPWQTYPPPAAQDQQPDGNGNGDYADDGAPAEWLPALGL